MIQRTQKTVWMKKLLFPLEPLRQRQKNWTGKTIWISVHSMKPLPRMLSMHSGLTKQIQSCWILPHARLLSLIPETGRKTRPGPGLWKLSGTWNYWRMMLKKSVTKPKQSPRIPLRRLLIPRSLKTSRAKPTRPSLISMSRLSII